MSSSTQSLTFAAKRREMSEIDYDSVITIYAEATPNPETLKFVVNKQLADKGVFEFESPEEAEHAPLAKMLFEYESIDKVFIMNNFITLTKKPDYRWVDLIQSFRDNLKQYIEGGGEIISPEYFVHNQVKEVKEEDEVVIKIKQILENQIKPAVEMDGGFIEFKSIEEGIVTLVLRGACSGCPSSMVTLKAGIEGLLKRFVPEVKEVRAEAM